MTALLGTGSHVHAPEFSDAELAELNRQFETAPAETVIEWAIEQFHPFMCLAASMTDAVLIDLAVSVEPSIEVVFIDTTYHFPETLETVERVRRHYGLNLRVLTVSPSPSTCGRPTRSTAARRPRWPSSTGPWWARWPG